MTSRTDRRPVRLAGTLAATAALTVVTASCSAPGGGTESKGPAAGTAVVGIAYEPDSLSPLLGYGKDGNSKIFDGLLTHDEKLDLKPALATALPEISEDGRTYTFQLREGVTFTDGKPFTARDVVFTYETILDPNTNNASRTELDALDRVEAEGDHTVVFHLKYPYAPFAERTVLPIAPAHIAGEQDVNSGDFTTKPVGTGPYELVSWSKGRSSPSRPTPTTGAARRRSRTSPWPSSRTTTCAPPGCAPATSTAPSSRPTSPGPSRGGRRDLRRQELRLPRRHAAHRRQGHRRHRHPPCPRPRRRP